MPSLLTNNNNTLKKNASVLQSYASYIFFSLIVTGIFSNVMNFKINKIKVGPTTPTTPRTQDNYFTIVQVSPVPESYELSQVLLEITPYVKDALGIMRVADYKAKRLGETVYLYFANEQSAQYLESIRLDINNVTITPLIVPMKKGRAVVTDRQFNNSLHGVPITIILKELERQQEAPIYYLLELVRYFEKKGITTGVRLGYDEKRNWTTRNGFVTFLRQADARATGGEGCYYEHELQQNKFRASLSENVPMLVATEDLDRFKNGIVDWDKEAEAINQLIITFEFPGFLNCQQKVDNRKLVKDLHKKYDNVNLGASTSSSLLKRRQIIPPGGSKKKKTSDLGEKSKEIDKQVEPQAEAEESAGKSTETVTAESEDDVLRIDLEADMTE